MNDLNKTGLDSDTGDWVIVLAVGRAMVGVPDAPFLSPAYDFSCGALPSLAQTPKGPAVVVAMMAPNVSPVLGLASLRRVPIPDGAIVIPLSELGDADRAAIMVSVRNCEEQVRQLDRRNKLAAEVGARSGLLEVGARSGLLVKP